MRKSAADTMSRRGFVFGGVGLALSAFAPIGCSPSDRFAGSAYRRLTDAQWRARLPEASYHVLRQDATERSHSSPLVSEHRKGLFNCRGCALLMFRSDWKYDSGTGWPSFFRGIRDNVLLTPDRSLLITRTAFQCARCKGHAGHIFTDGPQPTGERWCTNGAALAFVAT